MDETLYALALARLDGLSQANARLLYRAAGSARAVYEGRKHPEAWMDNPQPRARKALEDWDAALARAQQETAFAEQHDISILLLDTPAYPRRLAECDDPPLALFYRGTARLNAPKVVSVVGTRHATPYGKEICRRFCEELAAIAPDAVVVSGLAYGIDIQAHRHSLAAGLDTVAVLAHGLDRIYPSLHRQTATEMLRQGGLLTEYMTGTVPDKSNFVRRNRIVAGIADATVVVESAEKGGALITASLAQDYNREVFAFPGRATDEYSRGCNRIISTQAAQLATCAADVAAALGWQDGQSAKKPVQRELFPQLSPEEEHVCALLRHTDGKQLNRLAVESDMPVHRLSALLFEMEMKGIVKLLAGGRYLLLD